ncbi:hypothetical protein C3486_03515 [Streptomyces sp. Ru73]|uniref:hypothetical protein n=1 Tax=Streptomyces sp. Ru73 TaxID=2080748 RepID=UPI000CDDAEAC|nr:hypothetical protein [Streptomyces sp. Ru73]POX42654.1 hypothetical protein C3486_03515 [Streptomyces sp. Ru73]
MKTRTLNFGLYADDEGLAWAGRLVDEAVASRGARLVGKSVVRTVGDGGLPTAELYDFLAEQWAWEHPGQDSGAREPVHLKVRLVCSLRTWRAIRKAVLRSLCPEGSAPHACRVPWFAA